MGKIKNPIRFSEHFNIDEKLLNNAGVLNPNLNLDTALFIDPMLLEKSRHPEIQDGARKTYEDHFGVAIRLLRGSRVVNDAAWRSARRHLSFPEIKWTCLGYGSSSVSGSGSGADMTQTLIATAKQIVDLGVEDPDLFVAMALFEEGFGPDRISDMTANVIMRDLLHFNRRVLSELSVPCKTVKLRLRNGAAHEAKLPINPFVRTETPIVLVPQDILRDLPISKDWDDVAAAAALNEEYRQQVNSQIADFWKARSRDNKDDLRRWALSSKISFEIFLEIIHGANPTAYDIAKDPLGELVWRKLAATLADQEPFTLNIPPQLDLTGISSIVNQIIEQFRFLIEDRRFSEELYHEGRPRPERAAQRLFFAVAHAYCKANNLDLTPEADTGNGPVDFKVSSGFRGRVLVEVKLSTNSKVIKGYLKQLETYKRAEETIEGYYIIIDVGSLGEKARSVFTLRNQAIARGDCSD